MRRLRDGYARLPRAARWALWAVLIFVAYFLLAEPAFVRTDEFNGRADAIDSSLARERAIAAAWSDSNTPAAAARAAFGAPLPPGPSEARSRALYTRVNRILESHRVAADITERRAPLRETGVELLAGPGNRVDRFILDLTFESTPETAAAVVADLESAEEVAAVSRVQMRRAETARGGAGEGAGAGGGRGGGGGGGTRRVRVTLSPEAWILVPAGGRAS
jgi:uncharacterized membrane protein YgcG